MTDNEIIELLNQCDTKDINIACVDSMFSTTRHKTYIKFSKIVDIINRQQAEIKRLNACVKSEEEVREIMKIQMMPVVNEIVDELFGVAIKSARAKAIREFSHLLIDRAENGVASIADLPDLVIEFNRAGDEK